MSREDFITRFGDKLTGLLLRNYASAKNQAGDAQAEGRAIINAMRAAREVIDEMWEALQPQTQAGPLKVAGSQPKRTA